MCRPRTYYYVALFFLWQFKENVHLLKEPLSKKRAVFIILMKRDMQGFIIDRTKSPEFSGKIDFVLFPVQKGKVFKNIDMRKYEVL